MSGNNKPTMPPKTDLTDVVAACMSQSILHLFYSDGDFQEFSMQNPVGLTMTWLKSVVVHPATATKVPYE